VGIERDGRSVGRRPASVAARGASSLMRYRPLEPASASTTYRARAFERHVAAASRHRDGALSSLRASDGCHIIAVERL
jgi:hypothetical protein